MKTSKLFLLLVLVVFVGIALAAVLITTNRVALAEVLTGEQGECVIPPDSNLTKIEEGNYRLEDSDTRIFVLNGVALGKTTETKNDSATVIPPCYIWVKGLAIAASFTIVDDSGNKIEVVKAIVQEGVLPVEKSPLP